MKKTGLLSLGIFMAFILIVGSGISSADTFMSIGTGGVTGVYYPLGGAIANLITKNIPGYNCTAESTGGSVENAMLIYKNKIDIGFVDASSAFNAPRKKGAFAEENVENMRGIVSMYPEAVQIVTLNEDIKTIADLKGERVAVGSPGSGTEVMAKDLLDLYGLSYADIKEDFLGFGDASSGLKDKTIDAAFIWAGVPTSGIMELGTQHKVRLLNFSDDMVKKLKISHPFCVPVKITKEQYNSLMEDINTIAIPATLQCRADLPDEFVYNFLVVLFNNLPEIAGAHARGGDLSLEGALYGMDIEKLHPGAIKFYKEKGLLKK